MTGRSDERGADPDRATGTIPGEAGVNTRTGPRPGRVAGAVVTATLLVVLSAVAARVARVYPVSSDDATGVLEAEAVLSGNLILRGWTLSNVSFYTTDLPIYVAAVALVGPRPSLLRDVPVAVYAAAVVAAALLARGASRDGGGVGVAVVVVLLGLPAGALAEFVTRGYVRVGTTAGVFVALLALDVPKGRGVGLIRLGAFAVLMSLTLMADTYALVVGALAVGAVCLRGGVGGGVYEGVRVGRVALATVGAVAASEGLSWLIGALGGYRLNPLPWRYHVPYPDPFGKLARNLGALAAYLPALYRCDARAGPVAVRAASLIGPGLVLLALARGCPFRSRRAREDGDFVGDVLWVSALLGLAVFVAGGIPKDRPTARYLIPFVLTGAVLAGRVLGGRARDLRPLFLALGLLGLGYAATVAADLRKPPAAEPARALAGWLGAHGLRHGYGPFWDASVVTVTSGGRVAVRAVRGRPAGRNGPVIEPFRWMADERWYDEGPATFVVFRPDPGSDWHYDVNETTCAACFGPPSARHEVGPYVVLVWGRDLRPLLTRRPGRGVKKGNDVRPRVIPSSSIPWGRDERIR